MTRVITFGYNPPTGERGDERVVPHTFVRDLQHVLDYASRYFSSFWVADHFMTDDRFRLEGWTQLSWMAASHFGFDMFLLSFAAFPELDDMRLFAQEVLPAFR